MVEDVAAVDACQEQEREHHEQQRRSVCLFGLSGDPPTGRQGHVGIVRALQRTGRWDAIWVVPVYRHTFAEKQQRLVSFEHRLQMCRLAFEPLNDDDILDGMTDPPPPSSPSSSSTATTSRPKAKTRIVVLDAERSSWEYAVAARPQLLQRDDQDDMAVGTASLLRYLHQAHPTTQFSFCLGADSYQDLLQGKWREGASVLELLDQDRLVVFARGGVNGPHQHQQTPPESTESSSGRHSFVTVDELSTISSTQVRACRDVALVRTMVPPAVLQYMQQHELYMFTKTPALSALSMPTTSNV